MTSAGRTSATRTASISAAAALVLAAVWFFWPAPLGGAATYVSTHGVSMEPGFRTGDLAVLRSAGSYAVGDVVAYRSPTLDTVVMHRIVAGDARGFTTQGDNNDWLDEDRPAAEELLGSLVVRIPQGGTVLAAVRSPWALAVLAVAGAALAALLRASSARRSTRSPRRRPGGPRPVRRPSPGLSRLVRARARQVALGAAVVALVAGAGCAVLATTPVTQTETTTLDVVQQGQFSYSGQAVPGTTYPSGAITTGDTVWTRLAQGLTVSFTNTISGPELADVDGVMRLDVSVTASDGWRTTFASSPEVAMVDGTATAAVPIDVEAAARLLEQHYAEIGSPGGQATLTVTPVAQTLGTARGVRFTAGSPAPMTFTLDATALRPSGDLAADLAPTTVTPVDVAAVVPRTLVLADRPIPLRVARVVAATVLLAALVVFTAGAWIGRTVRGGVADRFLVRHADRIVPVEAITPGPAVIDVADASSLHRVAERFDTVVLHQAMPDHDVFVVRDVDATYRLVVPGGPGPRRGKPPVPGRASAPDPVPVADADPGAEPQARPVAVPGTAAPDPTSPLPLVRSAPPPPGDPPDLWGRVA